MKEIDILNTDNTVVFTIDKALYELEMIEAASIPFMPFSTIEISANPSAYLVTIMKDSDSNITPEELKKALLNNLIHESLRRKIADKTEMERNLILSYTFSNTKLME